MKSLLFALIILLSISITTQATADDKPLQGQAKIDSLLAELPKAKGDTNEVLLLKDLSYALAFINPDEGLKYGTKGLNLAKEISWEKGEANAFNSLGVNYYTKSDYHNTLDSWKKSLKINEELGNKFGVAKNLMNIGTLYRNQSDYPKALEYYKKSLKINEKLEDKIGAATNLVNIGMIYRNQSDYPKALKYYGKSLRISEVLEDKDLVAKNLGSMGSVYYFQSDFPKALEYYGKALKIFEERGYNTGRAVMLGNMASVYKDQLNYSKALEYYEKALKLDEQLGNKAGVASTLGNMGLVYSNNSDYLKALEYYEKALKLDEEIGYKSGVARHLSNIGALYLKLSLDSVSINSKERNEYISLNKRINLDKSIEYNLKSFKIYEETGEIYSRSILLKNLATAFEQKGDMRKAYDALEKHHKLRDSIFNQEKSDKIAAIEKAREDDVNRIKIEKQEVQLAAQESEKMYIIYSGIGIIAFVVAILALIAYQRKKSDKLLYNVLPISIAKRLKKKEHPISDHFVQASIIFIDIVGFTAMSKDSDPTDIVKALNKVFTHYDSIASKHGLEKIKTIGDCYMAAAGIPVVQKDNTLRAARMAIEVRDYMVDYYTDHGFKLDVRIGLDCGPVVAGVIGEQKFIYDMWSDAVNTASRMESTGTPNKVHITENFKLELENHTNGFAFSEPIEIEIKGKGMMKTYYIEGKQFSHSEAT